MKEKVDVNEQVQKLIISFSEPNLTAEEQEICLHIWKKLTRKKILDITRTRADIWAAAVIWSFCRANFKYEEGITLEGLCDFFNTKKSTVGTKAGQIIKMLKMDYFSREFSSRKIQERNPSNLLAPKTDTDDEIQFLKEVNAVLREPDPKRRQAEETLDDGLDILEQGDEETAGRFFFKSIEIDPTYADGYNHLANIAWGKGDWKQAEGLYRKALTLAEPEVKDIPRGDFWGVLESRPFMRALDGLGLSIWKQGRFEEAKGIFEKMLKLNSNDNLGVRYLIGPLYHQMGNLDKAAVWYDRNADDPHNLYNYGLLLVQKNELEMAIVKLIAAVFENPYIAPMLLKEKLPDSDWWHGSNLAEPQYAEKYFIEYLSLWEKEESAFGLLRSIWNHGEVQRTLRDYIAIRRAIGKSSSGDRGMVSRRLIGPEKIKKLASKIIEGLTKDKTGQMELM